MQEYLFFKDVFFFVIFIVLKSVIINFCASTQSYNTVANIFDFYSGSFISNSLVETNAMQFSILFSIYEDVFNKT